MAGAERSNRRRPPSAVEEYLSSSVEVLDMSHLRDLSSCGVPEGVRPLVWKLLLGLLPPDRSRWSSTLERHRRRYLDLKSFSEQTSQSQSQTTDDPLLSGTQWQARQNDAALRDVIDRDVRRTLPTMHFFSSSERHTQALRDVLFVQAKFSPLSYVQGMNEVLAPIYYCFAQGAREAATEDGVDVEADAFYCFSNLMGEINDCFCQKLDSTMLGVQSTVGRFNGLVAALDPELWRSLDAKQVDPRFYSLRWLSLLFSQEFELPDVLRLWDTLFADHHRFDLLIFFAAAVLLSLRERLLRESFSENLSLLQNLPVFDVDQLIADALKLREQAEPGALEPPALEQALARVRGEQPLSKVDSIIRQEEEMLRLTAFKNSCLKKR